MTFGSEFCRLLKLKGVSQKVVAASLKVDTAYVSRFANNSYVPREERIAQIAVILKLNEQERDRLFFAAGKIPPEVAQAMRRYPDLFQTVRWAARRMKLDTKRSGD